MRHVARDGVNLTDDFARNIKMYQRLYQIGLYLSRKLTSCKPVAQLPVNSLNSNKLKTTIRTPRA